MIELTELANSIADEELTEATRRLLLQIARRFNQVWRELEALKESQGFYNPSFPFLTLPREVRDKIYLYCLQAPLVAEPRLRPWVFLCFENYPWKPPTPGLLLVNRQIYSEAVELLYSKNTFSFKAPQELLEFERRIAPSHLDIIRRIRIWVVFPFTEGEEVSPDRLPLEKYHEHPLHWAKALQMSRLDRLQKISIAGQCPMALDWELMPMPYPLRESVEGLFLSKARQRLYTGVSSHGFLTETNLKVSRILEY